MQIKTKIVSCHTTDSKPVKQGVNSTVIFPPLVFPGPNLFGLFIGDEEIKFYNIDTRWASSSVSETYRPLIPATSKPLSDNESPGCMAFLKNDALCHRRLQSGLGEGGSRSVERWVNVLTPVVPRSAVVLWKDRDFAIRENTQWFG